MDRGLLELLENKQHLRGCSWESLISSPSPDLVPAASLVGVRQGSEYPLTSYAPIADSWKLRTKDRCGNRGTYWDWDSASLILKQPRVTDFP